MSASKRPGLAHPGAAWLASCLDNMPRAGADRGCAAEAHAAQLGRLSEPLQALLVPRLSLADVQRLGQTCRAARALVLGLPEATLRQLAEARALWPMAGLAGLHTWLSPQGAQGQQLPAPQVGMRQQLGLWASHAAAVRAGDLQLSCKLGGLQELGLVQLSPRADQAAVCPPGEGRTVVLVPLTGPQHDLHSELSAQPPNQTLTLPGSGPGQILTADWSPSGQHLVLVSQEDTSAPPRTQRVSTFRGAQLVGSFLEPLEDGEQRRIDVHILDDAATMLLVLSSSSGSRVVACTPHGAVLARHPRARTAYTAAWLLAGDRVLQASSTGDRLYIYSATSVHEISLGRAPAHHYVCMFTTWGRLAVVLRRGHQGHSTLLFVDLVGHRVRQAVELSSSTWQHLASGARSVAVADAERVKIVASAGNDMGREQFSCRGQRPRWDSLGRFLAVTENQGGVRVLDGFTGAPLASWPAYALLRWLPDSGVLVTGNTGDQLEWSVLRFVSHA